MIKRLRRLTILTWAVQRSFRLLLFPMFRYYFNLKKYEVLTKMNKLMEGEMDYKQSLYSTGWWILCLVFLLMLTPHESLIMAAGMAIAILYYKIHKI